MSSLSYVQVRLYLIHKIISTLSKGQLKLKYINLNFLIFFPFENCQQRVYRNQEIKINMTCLLRSNKKIVTFTYIFSTVSSSKGI